MIRYKDKTLEDYFIDPVTAVITDKDGNVQETHLLNGRPFFKSYAVHRIQVYTAYGYKEGYDVHHLDEDKMNNSLANLAYIPKSEHMRLHGLNKTPIMLGKHHTEETKHKMSKAHKGYQCSEETRRKLREASSGPNNGHYGKPCSEYVKKCLTESNSGNKNGNFGKHWWTNGVENIIAEECPEGFVKGYHHSEETRQKMSKALKGIGLGKHLSEEHRQKIREGVLRHNKEKAQ